MPVIARGTDLHPEGEYPAATLVSIDLPAGPEGARRDSPFGPWLRVLFETHWGTVATMISPAYVPGSDLWYLTALRFGREKPETVDTDALLGLVVPITVVHQREHGALMAVARIGPPA